MFWLLIFIVLSLGLYIYLYNRIIKLNNLVIEAWSGIDVQLKRRFDLITSLVEVVKGYAKYESSLLERIVGLRTGFSEKYSIKDKASIENDTSSLIKNLFALAESYPDLKANQSFIGLQKNITDMEEQIQYARRYYNGTVRDFNILIQSFPGNIFAGFLGYKQKEFFEINLATQKESPEINLQ